MGSPSNSIYIAFFYEENDLISAMPGVVQKMPHLTPGVEKVDLLEAITISVDAIIWSPAAATIPFTTDTTGNGNFLKVWEISPAKLNAFCAF